MIWTKDEILKRLTASYVEHTGDDPVPEMIQTMLETQADVMVEEYRRMRQMMLARWIDRAKQRLTNGIVFEDGEPVPLTDYQIIRGLYAALTGDDPIGTKEEP